MAKSFSSEYIRKLNAQHSGGVFLQAVEITETLNPLVIRRFVSFAEVITFNDYLYQPLHMEWSGLEVGDGMVLPTASVVVPAANGIVMDWVESFDIRENDARLQILHLDLLHDLTALDEILLQVQSVVGEPQTGHVTFVLGLNLGLSDSLPRGVALKTEFPGMVDSNVKILV